MFHCSCTDYWHIHRYLLNKSIQAVKEMLCSCHRHDPSSLFHFLFAFVNSLLTSSFTSYYLFFPSFSLFLLLPFFSYFSFSYFYIFLSPLALLIPSYFLPLDYLRCLLASPFLLPYIPYFSSFDSSFPTRSSFFLTIFLILHFLSPSLIFSSYLFLPLSFSFLSSLSLLGYLFDNLFF